MQVASLKHLPTRDGQGEGQSFEKRFCKLHAMARGGSNRQESTAPGGTEAAAVWERASNTPNKHHSNPLVTSDGSPVFTDGSLGCLKNLNTHIFFSRVTTKGRFIVKNQHVLDCAGEFESPDPRCGELP